jgi:hypothetical protein
MSDHGFDDELVALLEGARDAVHETESQIRLKRPELGRHRPFVRLPAMLSARCAARATCIRSISVQHDETSLRQAAAYHSRPGSPSVESASGTSAAAPGASLPLIAARSATCAVRRVDGRVRHRLGERRFDRTTRAR